MLSLPPTVRVYVAVTPVDGRKGIDGLAATVRAVLGHDPLCGALFVFLSKRRDRARILYYSHNGYWLLCKRLERGRFHLPWQDVAGPASRPLEHAQLLLLLEGIDLRGAHHRPRWQPAPGAAVGASTQ